MKRKDFLSVAGTALGSYLLIPKFLTGIPISEEGKKPGEKNILVFLQLNGGNDGLNTFIPIEDPAYKAIRGNLAIDRNNVLNVYNGMAWHPSLLGLNEIQQAGDLTVLQNVGYPNPSRSHFRAMEIWQTASAYDQYLTEGWIGRYLDANCPPDNLLGALNIDATESLALRSKTPHNITMQDPNRYEKMLKGLPVLEAEEKTYNPNLDFVRKLSISSMQGADEIKVALQKADAFPHPYPATRLAKSLQWIAKMILGDLQTSIYYTGMSGFDTHINQLPVQRTRFEEISGAVSAFYQHLKGAGLIKNVTLVIFSEFGRRVAPNGSGTDHGKAGPLIIVGGNNRGKIIGKNPDLLQLDQGDLKYETDFRAIYATLLSQKLGVDPKVAGIQLPPLIGIF
jgi:uncharacterized protein (DUF1501 family)